MAQEFYKKIYSVREFYSIGQLRPLLQETEQLPPLQEQEKSGAVVHYEAYERKHRDCREQVETP